MSRPVIHRAACMMPSTRPGTALRVWHGAAHLVRFGWHVALTCAVTFVGVVLVLTWAISLGMQDVADGWRGWRAARRISK